MTKCHFGIGFSSTGTQSFRKITRTFATSRDCILSDVLIGFNISQFSQLTNQNTVMKDKDP